MLALLSGGAFSHARLAFFLVPVAVAFRFRLSITIAAALVTTAAYVIQAALHPAAGQPEAARFILTQAGYLAWVGVACVLLSMLLARRTATVERLAQERSRLLADALEAEQRERSALAEALHDHAIQNLLSARHDLQEAGEVLPHPALARADEALARDRGPAARGGLRPPPVRARGGRARGGLRSIAQQVATRAHLDLRLDLHASGRHPQEQLVFSAARELLANVARHADATRGDAWPSRRTAGCWSSASRTTAGLPARAAGAAAGGRPRRPRVAARPHRGGGGTMDVGVLAGRRDARGRAAAGPLGRRRWRQPGPSAPERASRRFGSAPLRVGAVRG